MLLLLFASCCSALSPSHAPRVTIDITASHSVTLRVPEDDSIMEAVMSRAHAEAAAAGPDLYDEVMEERCRTYLGDHPQYWAQVWPSAVAASRRILLDTSLVSVGRQTAFPTPLRPLNASELSGGVSFILHDNICFLVKAVEFAFVATTICNLYPQASP